MFEAAFWTAYPFRCTVRLVSSNGSLPHVIWMIFQHINTKLDRIRDLPGMRSSYINGNRSELIPTSGQLLGQSQRSQVRSIRTTTHL